MREGEVLEGRFRIGKRAGQGAMGVVYVAEDTRASEQVAVKVLIASDPLDIARFDREVATLVLLQHPCVVRYIAHGRTGKGEPFLAMEWLAGETLKARFERGPLEPLEVIDIGVAIASALAGAHANGIVHRDVKPANIVLGDGGASGPKLLDFGVARLKPRRGMTHIKALTEAGTAVGTPAYMSPEQARGEDDVGPASDVFSLGTILFQLVARRLPFVGVDMLDVLLKLTQERAPPLAPLASQMPASYCALVDTMLDPKPGPRPTTSDVLSRLTSIRDEIAPKPAPPPPLEPKPAPPPVATQPAPKPAASLAATVPLPPPTPPALDERSASASTPPSAGAAPVWVPSARRRSAAPLIGVAIAVVAALVAAAWFATRS